MKAVILAGGLGTRLSEETYLKPKPMVEVGGKPILWHILKIYSDFGVDSESGLIHSVETTAANVHDLTPAAELLHGDETVVYTDAGYQGIEKRPEMQGRGIGFRVAMRPGKRRALADTPEGRLMT